VFFFFFYVFNEIYLAFRTWNLFIHALDRVEEDKVISILNESTWHTKK